MAAKRRVTVPFAVEVEIEKIGEENKLVTEKMSVSFAQFVYDNPMNNPKMGKDLASLLLWQEWYNAIRTTPAGDSFVISDKAWQLVRQLVCSPDEPYNPRSASALISFMIAIAEAQAVNE